MLLEQVNLFNNEIETICYDNEVDFVSKELKTSLLKSELNYNLDKNLLKDWFVKKFFDREDLENITIEDLFFIAEEKCNIKLN